MRQDTLCSWCHETETTDRYTDGLCQSCRRYRNRTGALPSDDVLSKRFGWPPYNKDQGEQQ